MAQMAYLPSNPPSAHAFFNAAIPRIDVDDAFASVGGVSGIGKLSIGSAIMFPRSYYQNMLEYQSY